MQRSGRDSGGVEAWITVLVLGIAQIAVASALGWFLFTAFTMRQRVNVSRTTWIMMIALAAVFGAATLIRGIRSVRRGLTLRRRS